MTISSQITVVVSTCPRRSHPSSKILDETIASVRKELPDSRIIVGCDGVRATLTADEMNNYDEFCKSIATKYSNTEVVLFPARGHQTGNMATILPMITTPFVFYCEDDWLILPHVLWEELCELIDQKVYNYIKLHAYPRISPWHEGHMVGRDHHEMGSHHVFCIRTIQFSANPHLASTDWYRQMSERFNFAGRVDFIEEALHGPISQASWEEYKLAIFNPEYGDFARCLHLDGKGTK